LSTEISQREQVNMILCVSVSTAEPFSLRKCKRRSCPLCRRPSNEQSYLSSKQPQLNFVLPKCNSERQTTVCTCLCLPNTALTARVSVPEDHA
jgi:hypothetical protein